MDVPIILNKILQNTRDMKYTIASLIACLSASTVDAGSSFWGPGGFWGEGGFWGDQPRVVWEKKRAYCHFTTDYYDWTKPRFLVDIDQWTKDGEVDSFKMALQAYNVGAHGDMLSVNSYGEADCAGDATVVVDGGVTVRSRWH